MDLRLIGTIFGFVIGVAVGGSMGVASGGNAVNGAYVFGPIFAIVGFLLGRLKCVSRINEQSDEEAQATDSGKPKKTEKLEGRFTDLANKAEGFLGSFVHLLCSLWNMQMRFLKNVGLMRYFVSMPWMFAVIGFLLLAVVPPVGAVFCLTAFAAIGKKIGSENEFMVLKE